MPNSLAAGQGSFGRQSGEAFRGWTRDLFRNQKRRKIARPEVLLPKGAKATDNLF